VGDLVYLKVQPYVQMSMVPRSCQKLSFHFVGPHKILQKVGVVAYKLDLIAHARIHNVVHVSQLKRNVPPKALVSFDIAVIQPESKF
jgi:hypothetical protein